MFVYRCIDFTFTFTFDHIIERNHTKEGYLEERVLFYLTTICMFVASLEMIIYMKMYIKQASTRYRW